MFDELISDDWDEDADPLVASIVRTVRTAEGAAYYDLPIGSKIVGKVRARLLEDTDNLVDDDDGGDKKIRISRSTHSKVSTTSEKVQPGDIITSKTRGPLLVQESKLGKDANGADVNELHLVDHKGKPRTRILTSGRSVATLVPNSKKAPAKVEKPEPKAEKPAPSKHPTAPEKVAPTPTPPAPEPKKVEKPTPAPEKKPDPKPSTPESLIQGKSIAQMTDREYETHRRRLERNINQAIKQGKATNRSETLNGDGRTWKPARAQQHKDIVDSIWKSEGENVPRDGHAVMAGGLGGSGKGTTLSNHAGLDTKNYLTIDPDRVKEEMAKRGMVPKVDGVAPMEAAALIQKESTHIAALLARRAYANKTNVIWDMTMANDGVVAKRLGQLKSNGYNKIDAVFVHVPASVSAQRALDRHRRGLEDQRNGKGLGGRYVPPEIIRATDAGRGDTYNHQVFQRFKGKFDEWVRYDNSVEGSDPKKLDGTGKWK